MQVTRHAALRVHAPHVRAPRQGVRRRCSSQQAHRHGVTNDSGRSTSRVRAAAVPGDKQAARAAPTRAVAVEQGAPTQAGSRNNAPTPAALQALFGKGTEQAAEVEVPVSGALPAWLSGALLVNGGGDFSRMRHMFDGFAMVAKFRVVGGQVWASQRFLNTQAYTAYKQQGRVVYREFDTPAEAGSKLEQLAQLAKQLWGLTTNNPAFTDNASVSLSLAGAGAVSSSGSGAGSGGRILLAMSETPAASYLINAEDLSTLQQVSYADGIPGDLTTAHPSVLPDGSLVNFTRSLPFGGFHVYRQDPTTLARTEVAFVPDRKPSSPAWVHDFGATPRHVVIIEHPLYMNLSSLLVNAPATHTFMNWVPEDEVKVHVVALDGSKAVRSFTCPTFFFFHVGNAVESADGSTLCVDVAAYDDPEILLDLGLGRLRQPALGPDGALQRQVSRSSYRRLTIPLTGPDGGRLQAPQPLVQPATHGDFCEFPQPNPLYRNKPYRYVYCLSAQRPTHMGNALTKLDLQAGTAQTWHSPGGAVGEPVFVPRPGATAEDDGVVLAPGIDADGRGIMLVMQAGSWTELARVTLPWALPNRFHGCWLPS